MSIESENNNQNRTEFEIQLKIALYKLSDFMKLSVFRSSSFSLGVHKMGE